MKIKVSIDGRASDIITEVKSRMPDAQIQHGCDFSLSGSKNTFILSNCNALQLSAALQLAHDHGEQSIYIISEAGSATRVSCNGAAACKSSGLWQEIDLIMAVCLDTYTVLDGRYFAAI